MSKTKEQKTIRVSVEMLQGWAIDLSQGDNSPRWEIEKILKENNQPIRNPLS